MMFKTWSPYGFDTGEDPFHIIRPHSRGIEIPGIKSAAVLSKVAAALKDMKPLKGHTLVHVAPVAASEYYSSNVNADGFTEYTCKMSHQTFLDGHNFEEHANKNPRIAFGAPVMSDYNPDMHRIEIVSQIDNEKRADIVEDLESGRPVNWSMACSPDPNAPVLTSRGYVPISKVRVGDLVLTHNRRWRRVTSTMKRQYSGKVVSFRTMGSPYTQTWTEEHPILAHSRNLVGAAAAYRSSYKTDGAAAVIDDMDWHNAGDLAVKDKVLFVASQDGECEPAIRPISEFKEEFVENVAVYNLSVEGDETYTVAGMVVHNCKVAFDVCSVCGNKATKPKGPCDQAIDIPSPGYCKHASKMLGRILDNGHRVHVDNPNPRFFDLSHVHQPAEQLAVSIGYSKAASANVPVEGGAVMAEKIGLEVPVYLTASLPSSFKAKLAVANKLAEIEKRVPVKILSIKQLGPATPKKSLDLDNVLSSAMAGARTETQKEAMLKALRNEQVVMTLPQFAALVTGSDAETVKAAEDRLPTMYQYLETQGLLSDAAADGTYDDYSRAQDIRAAIKAAAAVSRDMSLATAHVQRRLVETEQAPAIKTVDAIDGAMQDESAERLLRKYAAYQLSELANMDERTLRVSALLTTLARRVD